MSEDVGGIIFSFIKDLMVNGAVVLLLESTLFFQKDISLLIWTH